MAKTAIKIAICLICIILMTSNVCMETNGQEDNQANSQANGIVTAQSTTVKSILEEMDKRINKDCEQKCEMEVWENNKMTEYFLMTNKAKDNNQYLLTRYIYPPQWVDTSLLMVKEDVWIYDGNSDRFMQMPANLAFGGTGLSHGDMLRLNISKNYDGKIIQEDNDTWTVSLSTVDKKMPYDTIEMVINKKWYYPISAKCFSRSKKQIKTIEYSDVKELNGTMKPTKYTFLSPFEPDKYTVMKIVDEKLVQYPDYIFNKWVLRSKIDEKF